MGLKVMPLNESTIKSIASEIEAERDHKNQTDI
jgi:hypothetical protein